MSAKVTASPMPALPPPPAPTQDERTRLHIRWNSFQASPDSRVVPTLHRRDSFPLLATGIAKEDNLSKEQMITDVAEVPSGELRTARTINVIGERGLSVYGRVLGTRFAQVLPGFKVPVQLKVEALSDGSFTPRCCVHIDLNQTHHLPRITIDTSGALRIHYHQDCRSYPATHGDLLKNYKVVSDYSIDADHPFGPTLLLTHPEEYLRMIMEFCGYSRTELRDFVRNSRETVMGYDTKAISTFYWSVEDADSSRLWMYPGAQKLVNALNLLAPKN